LVFATQVILKKPLGLLHSPNFRKMTPIPAKVVNIDRLADDYLITVRVMSEKDAGAFDRLSFGENKPDLGWYHYGWLDVVYRQDPDLKLGQSFPLWTNQ
jgi:hypothetical protein